MAQRSGPRLIWAIPGRAAAEAVELFPHGVWFVSLESVTDPALLLPTIAQTLGLYESGDRPLEEALHEHLGSQRALLVLDNFEQLLDAARAVSKLLDAAAGVKVLVTSRAPLRLAAEHAVPVPPLALPDTRSLPAFGFCCGGAELRLREIASKAIKVEAVNRERQSMIRPY